jgi:hypothetical protein
LPEIVGLRSGINAADENQPTLSSYIKRFALLLRKEPIAKLLKAKFEGSAGNRGLRLWGALLGSYQHRHIGESGSAA